MSAAAEQHHEVAIGRFRKNDFEELEMWAEEAGVSTDELSSQIVRMAAQYLSRRRAAPSENVVPFGPVG